MKTGLPNFKELFYEYYQPLCNHAFKYLSDRDESEDVVQEVMIRFWELRKDMINDPAARYYLFTAVRNRCISVLRKNNKVYTVSMNEHELDIAEEIYQEEVQRNVPLLIEKAFETLSPKCAEVFKLSRIEKLKYNEIAERLDISVKTVENQMGKAIKHMREFVRKNPVFLLLFILFVLIGKCIGVLTDITF